ncbi:hypothetical protein SEA_BILLNYE_201 [Streptomyces phage BillNye]|uniref:Uncharacterized protein n=2 Tax=Wilnyevirus billnye TaxID=2560486 RepID=A0A2L1IW85_9CAUD|nr:hypothetical protein FDJ30_gp060 [Streptomyces phage BillNye]AVD99373.1 hypothetical protein SEA_BILLNYE_201 [Streptomyces phage BillNye]QBZ72455.1 hypothetical protein SEA_CIRCINUS_201 [Streptomyces phage Circinus]
MRKRSDGYMFAFLVNLAGFFINLALFIIWAHQDFVPGMAINGCAGAFSFTLAMVNLSRYLKASFDEDMDEIYRRIYGK